jgi:hypothetical protein
MPMVVESTLEFEFTRIAAVKVQSSFFLLQYNFHFKNEDIMLFRCWICVQYNVLQKYFFHLTTSGDLKMTFSGSNFSSNLVLKYVK